MTESASQLNPPTPPSRRAVLLMIARWIALGTLVGALCGAASALFLFALARATEFRSGHEQIVYLLPLAGALVVAAAPAAQNATKPAPEAAAYLQELETRGLVDKTVVKTNVEVLS